MPLRRFMAHVTYQIKRKTNGSMFGVLPAQVGIKFAGQVYCVRVVMLLNATLPSTVYYRNI